MYPSVSFGHQQQTSQAVPLTSVAQSAVLQQGLNLQQAAAQQWNIRQTAYHPPQAAPGAVKHPSSMTPAEVASMLQALQPVIAPGQPANMQSAPASSSSTSQHKSWQQQQPTTVQVQHQQQWASSLPPPPVIGFQQQQKQQQQHARSQQPPTHGSQPQAQSVAGSWPASRQWQAEPASFGVPRAAQQRPLHSNWGSGSGQGIPAMPLPGNLSATLAQLSPFLNRIAPHLQHDTPNRATGSANKSQGKEGAVNGHMPNRK